MLGYFSLTLFASATLLFLVQPMIGKMILPQLGGTPAVWNTCMVFFQAVLLVGYGYTHVLTTTQPTRRQVAIQVVMLFFPFLVLPFAVGNWEPPTDSNPVFSLLWKLTIMVGLPFFAVSTTAPLLQKWFVHTGHPAAKDPYFLYGASNLGSMLGLALYPTVIEPWLQVAPLEGQDTVHTQVHLWMAGFAIFVALVIGSAVVVWRALAMPAQVVAAPVLAAAPEPERVPVGLATAIAARPKRLIRTDAASAPPVSTTPQPGTNDDITVMRRVRWVGLAAVPSSLMLGCTTYMTTDIAAVAFFWILPLAMYLMTFILVFSRWPTVWTETPHTVVLFLHPCFLLFLVLVMIAHLSPPTWLVFALHLLAFIGAALMCHGELAKDRPSTKHLTEFYFWMSMGGVLGGLFNALFAPIAFQTGIWEYPIAMMVACLLRPNLVEEVKTLIPGDSTATASTPVGYALDWSMPIIIGATGYFLTYVATKYASEALMLDRFFFIAVLAVIELGWTGYLYYRFGKGPKIGFKDFVDFVATYRSKAFLAVIGAFIVAGLIYAKAPRVDISMLMRRSYLLAALVVVVLSLSLRPVRFGLSVGALFLGLALYDRVHDPLLYEGRGFFGLLRVRETEGRWYALARVSENEPQYHEWKQYRELIHGGINHGRQIVAYKDEVVVVPGLAGSTVSLLTGQMPIITAAMSTYAWEEIFFDRSPHAVEQSLTTGRPTLKEGYSSKTLTLKKRREPITYFHHRNGVAEIYGKFSWPDWRLPVSMAGLMGGEFSTLAMLANTQSEPAYAVLGLGTGILASYGKPYQTVHFYEIDPLVKQLSIVPGYVPPWHKDRASAPKVPDPVFYFVHDAQERWTNIDVILGDGRLKIRDAPEKYYHIISLDAFSSDAIPVHLLTADAVELYMSKLADGGVLIFNTTNRYVRIEGVLAAIAKAKGYECLHCPDYGNSESFPYHLEHPDRYSADWVVLQRKSDKPFANGMPPIDDPRHGLEKRRKRLAWNGRTVLNSSHEAMYEDRWQTVEPLPGPIWTDAYSNLLTIMRWRN